MVQDALQGHPPPEHCPRDRLHHSLPIPPRPWSRVAVDFVTGLPPSEGNTVILTIVDRFSSQSILYLCLNFPQP